ncbi:MAG TPA: AAA family ATPase [Candidatus Lokiarchaeia archaeon]|nr:AAA family ATPase [Candidatus Lokiarchaeia archaeon]
MSLEQENDHDPIKKVNGDGIDFADKLMDDLLQKKSLIFKERTGISPAGRDVLSSSYKPENPNYRDEQIKQLVEYFKPCFRNEAPANLLIYGKTGTGKTLISKHVASKILERSKNGKEFFAPFIIYINVKMCNTKYRILAKICEDLGLDVPKTGLATDQVLETLKSLLKREGRNLVTIIDEIDLLVRSREKDDLLYLLTRLSEEEPSVKVSIIGISNDLRFKTFLGIRVLSSLNAQEIVFPPYNIKELQSILMERAVLAFNDGVVEPSIMNTIATLAAREDGDARKALALLLKAAEVAEQSGSSFIDAEHVLKARDNCEFDTIEGFLTTLPDHYKLVIIGISNSQAFNKCAVNTGSLLRIFHELVQNSDEYTSTIGSRRLLQILRELNDHGIIDLHILSSGRNGRYNVASMLIDRKIIESVFSKDAILKKLLNYVPKTRCLDTFIK